MAAGELLPDSINACRTCGIFYLASSNVLLPIFSAPPEFAELAARIRKELINWEVEIHAEDGFPQHLCMDCVHKFQNILNFQKTCLDAQQNFAYYYTLRKSNLINIKTELEEEEEDTLPQAHFIYVDEFSDGEYDGTTPFEVHHVPIKEEPFEYKETLPFANISASEMPDDQLPVLRNLEASIPSVDLQHSTEEQQIQQDEEDCPSISTSTNMTNNESEFQCNLCPHISNTEQGLDDHNCSIHIVAECHLCEKKFTSKSALRYHMLWHKINKYVRCARCGLICDSRNILREHIRARHTTIRCSICKKLFLQKRIKSHMAKYHPTNDVKNKSKVIVDSPKEEQDQIEEHRTTNQNTSDRLTDAELDVSNTEFHIECALCDEMSFQSIAELERHVHEKHTPPRTLTPPSTSPITDVQETIECSKNNISIPDYNEFSDSYDSQSHRSVEGEGISEILRHDTQSEKTHEIDVVDQYACAECPSQFLSVEELSQHATRIHSVKQKFTCQWCKETFFFKYSLIRHLEVTSH